MVAKDVRLVHSVAAAIIPQCEEFDEEVKEKLQRLLLRSEMTDGSCIVAARAFRIRRLLMHVRMVFRNIAAAVGALAGLYWIGWLPLDLMHPFYLLFGCLVSLLFYGEVWVISLIIDRAQRQHQRRRFWNYYWTR